MNKNMTGGDACSGFPPDIAVLIGQRPKSAETVENHHGHLSDQAHAGASTIPGDEQAVLAAYQNPCSNL